MFYAVASEGSIQNLRLTRIKYTDANWNVYASGLVVSNDGYLFGDSVSGSVSISRYRGGFAAGLAASNNGLIASSSANVNTFAQGDARGLVVDNYGTISLSHANGDVTAAFFAGGLVAANYGTISLSYATGNVGAATIAAGAGGGLVAFDIGIIDQSFATGNVSAVGPAGGLVGLWESETATDTASNSYSTGAVITSGGGFGGTDSGYTPATISTSYSTGLVASGDGGFGCNMTSTSFSNDYWDTTTSGTDDALCGSNVSGITGLTTEQLQSGLPAGFNSKIWAENPNINNGLPYLINNPPPK